MKTLFAVVLIVGVVGIGTAKPLAAVSKFDGKFVWVKLAELPVSTLQSLANAKAFVVGISFPRDAKLKKNSQGNTWFTFVLADQGSDWKWNQTKGYGGVSIQGGLIKAGKYKVVIPALGIPNSVLKDKKQTISLGPAASGLATPASFRIDSIQGK